MLSSCHLVLFTVKGSSLSPSWQTHLLVLSEDDEESYICISTGVQKVRKKFEGFFRDTMIFFLEIICIAKKKSLTLRPECGERFILAHSYHVNIETPI